MGNRQAAIDFYNAGMQAIADTSKAINPTHSYQMFTSACYADPTYAAGFYQSGNNNSDLNLLHAAVACYRRALEVETDAVNRAKILCNLGWRLHSLGQEEEALEVSSQAVDLNPKLAYAWINLSLIHGTLDRPVTAIGCARKAFILLPDDATVEMALAWALLYGEQYQEGLKHFEARYRYRLHQFLHYPYPQWLGKRDQTVFVVADQGLGDTLSFARFIPLAAKRARFLHLAVQPELKRLFEHAFVGLPNVNIMPLQTQFPPADAWTTFMSLPFSLQLDDDAILNAPHISAPVAVSPASWLVPDRKFHIGIAWAGSPLNDNDRHRNVPIEHFLELYRVPGIQLYSIQCGDRKNDLNNGGYAPVIRDLSQYIRDVTDNLALLPHLDLVITCDSAPGHICGLVGKETWIPYSYLARDWRLGMTGKNPIWYPNHRVFRQDEDGAWGAVFERIVAALREKVDVLDQKA